MVKTTEDHQAAVDVSLAESSRLRSVGRLTDLALLAGPYLGLLLVVALFSFLTWQRGELARFLGPGNLKLIAVHSSVIAVVALGMTLIMISGGIDLSVGYVVSLITVVAVLAYNRIFHWLHALPVLSAYASIIAVSIGVGTGMLVGCVNGMLITHLKVVPFVVTLGMMGAAHGVARVLSQGQRVTFQGMPPGWVGWLGAIEPGNPWLVVGPTVWIVLFGAAVVAVLLNYTVLGRYCYALGSNEATARLCGIHVERTKIVLYTLAGLLTGLAGIMQLARSGAGSYDVAAGLELEVIAAVVIGGGSLSGGEGTVTGTLVGVLMIAVLENGCSKLNLPPEFRFIIIGTIIVGVSAVNAWRQRRSR